MRLLSLLALVASLPSIGQVGNLQLSTASLNFSTVTGSTLPQSQIVGVTSTGVALPVNVSVRYFTATEGWLSATSDSANTPASVTITVNASGLAAGVYNGQVLVVASGSQSGLVTVTFTVSSTNPTGSVIVANPASVSLASSGGQIVQSSIVLTSASSVPFQVFVNTSSGGNWLSYIASSTTSPTSITVSANPATLVPGVYTGTVSVVPSSGSPGVAIPVSFTVGGVGSVGGFSVSPTSLNFIFQTGTANPAAQSVYVSNFSGIVSYVATSSTSWARLTSNNNATPSQSVSGTSNTNLTVYVDPTGLTPGLYNATVTVSASNAASQTLSVALTVGGSSLLSASPNSFVFNYSPDAGIPASQQTVVSSTGASISFTASAVSTGWLLVGPQTGFTGGANVLTVSVNPVGLPSGTYTGSINVASGLNALNIPVTLTVGTSSFNSISASPQSLNFQSQLGGTSATQTLFLSASTTRNFIATASASGGNWLQVTPNSGATPASLTVSVNPLAVGQAGTYNGVIQISNLSDGTQLAVPVSMTLSGSGSSVTASPPSLSFNISAGTTVSPAQTVQLSGTPNTIFYISSDIPWLSVSGGGGVLPFTVTASISANAFSLAPGVYSGVITISGGSGAAATIPVTLNVTAASAPVLTPSNLTFQFTPGAASPAAQNIAVNSASGTVAFSVTSQTSLGGNWLSVTSSASVTPATLSVSVVAAGLAPGVYRGTITVTANADIRTAEVTLTVTAPAGPTLRTALHAATRQLSAVTPGMILSLQGTALGTIAGAVGTVTAAGAFETTYNGYRVLFDGVPAPILFSSDSRMDVVAPYSIAGRRSTRVQVENASTRSEIVELTLSPDAAPGIFSIDNSGRGQAAALNDNGTVNGPANPAAINGVLVFYATGEGQIRPAGQDGRIIATDLRTPVLPVAVNIGGVPVEVLYAGSAPNLVSGLLQVNVRLNADVPRGPAIPIELRVGPAPSQPGVTVAIQ
ncbi:MAG: BACON domain-containing protein [Bryobacteraceae bacterium]